MNVKKVKVGGHRVDIEYVDKFDTDIDGLCTPQYNNIKVKRDLSGEALIETLLHELLHFIDYVYAGYTLEEETVKIGTKYLFYIFNANDLFNLPDRIDILGFHYDVLYDYKFTNSVESLAYSIDHIKQVIRIDSSDMCKEYIVIMLLRSILIQLDNIYNVGFDDSSQHLAQGFYQLFIDNKSIYNLFKWGKV